MHRIYKRSRIVMHIPKLIQTWEMKRSKFFPSIITDLTLFIKVQYLLFITPFCNVVLGAHDWDMISCSIWKELNLLDKPPRSNQSALICLCNSLSNSTLNSMSLSMAPNFISTYPNLEYLSI